jgi:hypothetical protein
MELTFYISDWFTEGRKILVVIRRPFRGVLPLPQEGDGILLRNFVVRSTHHQLYLTNCDVSAWCVFANRDGGHSSGPLVEFGDIERDMIKALQDWWKSSRLP